MASEDPTPQQPPTTGHSPAAGPNDPTAAPADSANPQSASSSLLSSLRSDPPPDPLPAGWILRKSSRRAGSCYYYHQETGVCRWDPPGSLISVPATGVTGGISAEAVADALAAAAPRSILKRSAGAVVAAGADGGPESSNEKKDLEKDTPSDRGGGGGSLSSERVMAASSSDRDASRDSSADRSSEPSPAKKSRRLSSSSEREPDQVRVLHILKKHRGSRRPASWRNPKITDNREKAVSDLGELISILKESEGDPKELRATFEELARTESDCSSAKRGGDLGFFGRRKMQPNFEKASFALKIGQLSDVVDTSSGVHVILRLA
uniref:peptidylprolyl isomerase n=1 Tax=Odontella aurita TaxID=265563 RepID=A0A7S4JSN8_9STRA|eukprot:CAMPEP_0113551776 /NCGR_PEP_ID=MMETSP0015_2-20120614/14706_1 /TAXON_ID=2838 /ORGANISM="Odontella" /LENGTH=321 /DNA_ID=CAMNT_0000452693 /DNA_START=17 /DNA_END=982 /DNA_ORIENTATION=- /assembly_acc=CAM_ASM_000160